MYQIYNLIENNNINYQLEQKLKEIFIPTDLDEYNELFKMMKIVKTQSIFEEKERIQKELEIQKKKEELEKEIEEHNKLEKNNRYIQINLLILNLNKISIFDNPILILKNNCIGVINKYLELETDKIYLDNLIYEKLIEFINSIRIEKEYKHNLLNLIKNKNF